MEQIDSLLEYKAIWIAGVAIAFFVLERVFPRARPLAGARLKTLAQRTWRLARNFGLLLLNAGLSPVLVIPISALAASHGLGWRPGKAAVKNARDPIDTLGTPSRYTGRYRQ